MWYTTSRPNKAGAEKGWGGPNTCGIILCNCLLLQFICTAINCMRTRSPFVHNCHSATHSSHLIFQQVLRKRPTVDNALLVRSATAISCRPESSLHVFVSACQWRGIWHRGACVWPACIEAQSQQSPYACNNILCVDVSSPASPRIMVKMIARARSGLLCVYSMQKCLYSVYSMQKNDSLRQVQLQADISDMTRCVNINQTKIRLKCALHALHVFLFE